VENGEADLREIRALAAVVYPAQQASGHPVPVAIDNALDVAERIYARSLEREQMRRDVEAREREIALTGGRNGGLVARRP
jgi:hypothetical protein